MGAQPWHRQPGRPAPCGWPGGPGARIARCCGWDCGVRGCAPSGSTSGTTRPQPRLADAGAAECEKSCPGQCQAKTATATW